MSFAIKKGIGEDQMKELNIILALVDKFKTTTAPDEKNQLIKMLAVRHVTTKAFLSPNMKEMFNEEDIKFVETVDKKLREILMPVYNSLLKLAVEDCREWFLQMMRKKGQSNPKLYPYQIQLIEWLLRAIIVNELNDAIYTLLVSRRKWKNLQLVYSWVLHNAISRQVCAS